MTMPETIWVLPPIDINGFTFPGETTTPNFPNAHEYVLRSSVQAMIDAAIQSVGLATFKATSMFSNGGSNK